MLLMLWLRVAGRYKVVDFVWQLESLVAIRFVHELLIGLEESGDTEANGHGHACRMYLYTR
jgi:hypothetical protein